MSPGSVIWIFALSVWLLISQPLHGQLNADFSASVTSGCEPLHVDFTDLSTGNVTSWQWYLGNNAEASPYRNVGTIYSDGIYTVTLIVSDGTSYDTIVKKDFIKVYPKPEVNFTFGPTSGCEGLAVNFSDLTNHSTPITERSWGFGGPAAPPPGSNVASPQNIIYSNPGIYSLSLIVKDSNGCVGTREIPDAITIYPKPKATFTASDRESCDLPLITTLTADEINPNYTYTWTIEGLGTFTGPQVSNITFNTAGQFDVKLEVRGAGGCNASLEKVDFLTANQLQASFSFSRPCARQGTAFVAGEVPGATYRWNFGDGSGNLTVQDPVHSYLSGGDYTVSYTITSANGECTKTVTTVVTIEDPIASFTPLNYFWCELPEQVNFTNTSTGATHYLWTFSETPATSNAFSISRTYTKDGNYEVRLEARSANCKTTEIGKVRIKEFHPLCAVDKESGCYPLTVNFTDQTLSDSAIVSYSWTFGDGGTSILQNPAHTFDTVGHYTVRLQATNSVGCVQDTLLTIMVGDTPTASFIVPAVPVICGGDGYIVTDQSHVRGDPTLVNSWDWHFSPDTVTTGKFPVFYHRKRTGFIDIHLRAGYNGCYDDTTVFDAYYAFGPVINKVKAVRTCDGGRINFTAKGLAYNQDIIWDYGDGTSDTLPFATDRLIKGSDTLTVDTIDDPEEDFQLFTAQHQYAAPGSYLATLKLYSRGIQQSPFTGQDTLINCQYFDTVRVFIPNINAIIAGEDSLCKKQQTAFRAVNAGDFKSVAWYLNDSLVANDTVFINEPILFTNAGTYRLKLVVKDSLGCPVESEMTVHVVEPKPFIIGPANATGCAPFRLKLQGADSSGVAVKEWDWTFGPNVIPQGSALKDPDTLVFPLTGDYTLYLSTKNYLGCKSANLATYKVKVSNPLVSYSIDREVHCAGIGDSVVFTNTSVPQNGFSFKWIFSTGDTLAGTHAKLAADTIGYFTAQLVLDSQSSCNADTLGTFIVAPQPRVIDFDTDSARISNCYPHQVTFNSVVGPPGYQYRYYWGFGDNSFGFADIAAKNYLAPGEFDVYLKITDSSGTCADSLFKPKFITVKGPYAEFSISDDTICLFDAIQLRMVNAKNVESFIFDCGDGIIDSSGASPILHPYEIDGLLFPKLRIKSGSCEISYSDSLYVNNVRALFTIDGYPGHRVGIDTLYACDTLRFRATMLRPPGSFFDRHYWKLSAASVVDSISTTKDTLFQAGSFQVQYWVWDQASGCRDTLRQQIIVRSKPPIDAGTDSILCAGEKIRLQANGGKQYTWQPPTYLSSANIADPEADPPQAITYYLRGTDAFGCAGTDSVRLQRDRTRADFTILSKEVCEGEELDIATDIVGTNILWDIGGTADNNAVPVYQFNTPGKIPVTLSVYDLSHRCAKEKKDTVEVFPAPLLTLPASDTICLGDSLLINATCSGSGNLTYLWEPSSLVSDATILRPRTSPGQRTLLFLTVSDERCARKDSIMIEVDSAHAAFDMSADTTCSGTAVSFVNHSTGTRFSWNFTGDPADVSTVFNPRFYYGDPGIFPVRLIAQGLLARCGDTAIKMLVVKPPPLIAVTGGGIICKDDSLLLNATGGITYRWTPGYGLADSTAGSTQCYADESARYYVTVTDSFGCTATDSVQVLVHPDYTFEPPNDTAIIIYESVALNIITAPNVSYRWTPDKFISCTTCPDPVFEPLHSICYQLEMIDANQCYRKTADFCITVEGVSRLDVPTAFTPNGDGRNDRIYVKAMGIRRLINFTIYNRWGEIVFETSDISKGWDGRYKDAIQNDETYVYVVNAETFSGEILTKNGYISLLK